MPIHISGLWIYPVKGCRGIAVTAGELDDLGLAGDRRFLVVDATGVAITQRSHPALARIRPELTPEYLGLQCEGRVSLRVPLLEPTDAVRSVQVWDDAGLLADSCGAAADAWLSELLGTRAHLVRIGRRFNRPIGRDPLHHVHFGDAYPLLVISEASLEDLNQRLGRSGETPVPMDRFRPNLVVSGCAAFAEDAWKQIRVGSLLLRPTTLCSRCTVVTTDQSTGIRSPEPLRTLATYRRDPQRRRDVCFGRNVVNESKRGTLRVGDVLDVS